MHTMLLLLHLATPPAAACQCGGPLSILLHPVSLTSANRDTRVVALGYGGGALATDFVVAIDGVETTAFELEQEWSSLQSLTVLTFHETLPAGANVRITNADGDGELDFTTSDRVDGADPTWKGGVEKSKLLPEGDENNCKFGPYATYVMKGFDDDQTAPDDLLVELVSEYGEKAWGAYGAVGMSAEDGYLLCGNHVPSLADDLRQRFEVTFYDEAGNPSETHTVGPCSGCGTAGGGRASALGLLLTLGLTWRRRQRR
jgi:hypothetical protein